MEGRYSDDGRWWWDGRQWVPVAQPGPYGGAAPYALVVPFAGFWIRFAAWFIDSLVTFVGSLVIGVLVGLVAGALIVALGGSSDSISNVAQVVARVLAIVGAWLYFSLLHSSSKQASLGQMALGLSVTDYAGRRLGWGRASGRYFASLLSGLIFGIGYLLIAFTERKQALHDLIAGTVVVQARAVPGMTLQGTRAVPAPGGGVGVAIAVTAGLILLLFPIVVIVVLLTMGNQIQNVFSNVVVALSGS